MIADDKRVRILQAVEELLARRRWHEITTDEVAAVAKVGKGTLYKYFRDKDDLFLQTAMAGFDQLIDLLDRHLPGEAPFEAQLMDACAAVGGFFRHRRQVFRMMQAEDGGQGWCRPETKEAWMDKRRLLLVALGRVLQRGIDEGAVRDGVPAATLAAFLLGMLRTRARDAVDADDALIVELFLRGAAGARHAAVPAGGAA